jgi:diadenosine tetraphosphate (Ap4A) HIT family hydrolase
MNPCCFCEELHEGRSADLSARYGSGGLDRVVWRSEDFAVMPSIGQLVAGHLLMVTAEHVNSFAALSPLCRRRASQRSASLLAAVEDGLGPCLMFEHGTRVGATEGACGIVHAHLHVVPVGADAATASRVSLPGEVEWHELPSGAWVDELRSVAGTGEYLYVRLPNGRSFAAVCRDVPSQFLRRWASTVIGTPDWDWRCAGTEDSVRWTLRWMRATEAPLGFVSPALVPLT